VVLLKWTGQHFEVLMLVLDCVRFRYRTGQSLCYLNI